MQTFDALVVGGGPAGSSCARRLRRGGLSVAVLDRARHPRDKPCAGWITPQVVAALELDLADYARGRTLQRITGFRTGRLGGRVVETAYARPVSFGIRRCEFDDYLLRRSGASLRTGTAVLAMRRAADGWIVNDELRAPVLVGAGGHFCPVARLLGGGGGAEPIVAAQEVELAVDAALDDGCPVRAEVPELYFSTDLKGYGWCFRKEGVLNVGFGRLGRERLAGHVEAFLDAMIAARRLPASFTRRLKGHAYLLYETTPRPLTADGVLLAGDAAGLAYAPSGEGIRTAVESGMLAAETILGARGRYGRDALEPYRQRIRQRFGRPGPSPAAWLPESWLRAAGRALLASPWFSRRVVVERWFLRAGQPALALPALAEPALAG